MADPIREIHDSIVSAVVIAPIPPINRAVLLNRLLSTLLQAASPAMLRQYRSRTVDSARAALQVGKCLCLGTAFMAHGRPKGGGRVAGRDTSLGGAVHADPNLALEAPFTCRRPKLDGAGTLCTTAFLLTQQTQI